MDGVGLQEAGQDKFRIRQTIARWIPDSSGTVAWKIRCRRSNRCFEKQVSILMLDLYEYNAQVI